ncbi:MAG TPA: hypothetical protein VGD37_30160, partial [Kofleriaceae bacterium]
MRFGVCLVLASCAADTVSAPPAPTRVAPPQRPVAPPARPLTAAHGSDIVALGATADGLAVASA